MPVFTYTCHYIIGAIAPSIGVARISPVATAAAKTTQASQGSGRSNRFQPLFAHHPRG